jgi:hypothetical protein
MRQVDLLIIGSGPAGCSTALHLARLDPALARRTVILEKAEHPRHKLCGGGLVSDVDTILTNLGLDLREVPHVDAQWARMYFHGHGIRMKLRDIAFHVVRRREFDAWLADRARDCGVELQTRTQVTELRRVADGWLVDTNRGSYRAHAVIGADGTKGVTRRAFVGDAGSVARLVEVMIPPPDGPSPDPRPPDDEALFEFRNVLAGVQGYFWSFPMQIDGRPMRNLGVYDSRVVDTAPSRARSRASSPTSSPATACASPTASSRVTRSTNSPRGASCRPPTSSSPATPQAPIPCSARASASRSATANSPRAPPSTASTGATSTSPTTPATSSLAPWAARSATATTPHRSSTGLRSPLLQRIVWWYLRPLVRRFIHGVVFNWARPNATAAAYPEVTADADAAA